MLYTPRYEYERIKPKDDAMPEECGVFGVFMEDDAYDPAEGGIYRPVCLQHRGRKARA
jgi:amidophosphoribosyltransferase